MSIVATEIVDVRQAYATALGAGLPGTWSESRYTHDYNWWDSNAIISHSYSVGIGEISWLQNGQNARVDRGYIVQVSFAARLVSRVRGDAHVADVDAQWVLLTAAVQIIAAVSRQGIGSPAFQNARVVLSPDAAFAALELSWRATTGISSVG